MENQKEVGHGHESNHPSCFELKTLILLLALSVFGAMIGVQLITTLGVAANTSIIGAMIAMIIARIPLGGLSLFRSIHVQNLAQSSISAATFGAANCILMPIAVVYIFGKQELFIPVFIGVALATVLDAYLLYRLFNTRLFPAAAAWPPGIAAAEAIKAGDKGGKQAFIMMSGIAVGVLGAWFKLPMAAFGTAFIGNVWALTMLGIGFLLRGYSGPIFNIDINALYIPHGIMIGAGIVALLQTIKLMRKDKNAPALTDTSEMLPELQNDAIKKALRFGAVGFILISAFIAFASGLYMQLSMPWLIGFILYAALAAFIHEMIVGLAAMHSGWFPAFAVALITLLIGMLIGFPPEALVLLCAFSSSTGPAFADMGYDLKAGYLLRGKGAYTQFEVNGRRQQLIAAILALLVAMPVVYFSYHEYFSQDLIPPVSKVYVAAINAGISLDVAKSLAIWAIPGALIQWLGGARRQMGVLLATGLLINFPLAGWAVILGIVMRITIKKFAPEAVNKKIEIIAAGIIAGDAIFSFFSSYIHSAKSK